MEEKNIDPDKGLQADIEQWLQCVLETFDRKPLIPGLQCNFEVVYFESVCKSGCNESIDIEQLGNFLVQYLLNHRVSNVIKADGNTTFVSETDVTIFVITEGHMYQKVLEAIRKSRLGVVVILGGLIFKDLRLQKIVTELDRRGRYNNVLSLKCPDHGTVTVIANKIDFDEARFNGPCKQLCQKKCVKGTHEHCSPTVHACGTTCPPCMEICMKQSMACGHRCPRWCHEECDPCQVVVTRAHPSCPSGHLITRRCSDKLAKLPCLVMQEIKLACGHTLVHPCKDIPNLPNPKTLLQNCSQKCSKMFDASGCCNHKCTGNCCECYQGRMHKRCQEPCNRLLFCGHEYGKCSIFHPCVGICGEECPPYCTLCSLDELMKGMLLGQAKITPKDRFIYLSACRHSIEVVFFEGWLAKLTEDEEILPIRCPICAKRIYWMRRYSHSFAKNLHNLNAVRKKIYGDQKQILKIALKAHDTLQKTLFAYEPWKTDLIGKWQHIIFGEHKPGLAYVNFLEWFGEKTMHLNTKILQIVGQLPDKTETRNINLAQIYVNECVSYINMVKSREWPLHPNEMFDLFGQDARLESLTLLYRRLSVNHPSHERRSLWEPDGFKAVSELFRIICGCRPYTPEIETTVNDKLQELDAILHTSLGISDEEKKQVIRAFKHEFGKFYKCSKGHVYLVTECGGPITEAICNECGGVIGGINHVLVDGNSRALVMEEHEEHVDLEQQET